LNNQQPMQGFTLIEALVAMVIFAISFSGLYFLYGMALQSNSITEKKMYMNLMANRVIETIAIEAQRLPSDPLYSAQSPFIVPSLYSGTLNNCKGLSDPKLSWCEQLNKSIGYFRGTESDERRDITITSADPADPTGISAGLIVNVYFVVQSGAVDRIYAKTYATKHIRNYNQ